jgi:hypothetical protein
LKTGSNDVSDPRWLALPPPARRTGKWNAPQKCHLKLDICLVLSDFFMV